MEVRLVEAEHLVGRASLLRRVPDAGEVRTERVEALDISPSGSEMDHLEEPYESVRPSGHG
ncbi:hypothetical protein [Halorarum salinum]|uniref:hypothetical protein n=1 Tax=Halorarum salinum TaxID=2743089 RepID=UPI001FEB00E2|nr:hypothetical protein [Halobaculum salinum]